MNHRRDLAILVAAVGVSAAGDIAAVSALAVELGKTTGSGLTVAALFIANWLALALGAPWAGALVDRGDARRLLIVASLAQAGVAAALATTSSTAGILALSALLGAGAAVTVPAEFALLGAIAARSSAGAGKANSRVETARYAGYTIGPLAGTALVSAAGLGAALAADAVSFGLVAIAGAALQVRRAGSAAATGAAPRVPRTGPAAGTAAPKPRARDGVSLLFGDPVLRIATAVLVGSLIAMSTSISADVFFAQQTLGAGSIGLGLLLSAWMLGMVVGALGPGARVPAGMLAGAAVLAAALQGVGKLGAAAIGMLPAALALYLLGGAAQGVKNVSARTLIHERVAAEAHGRAFAAYAALRNGAELAALGLGGLLVELLGARVTLAVAGAGTALVGIAGYLALQRPRRVVATAVAKA
jgi:MFS transporter